MQSLLVPQESWIQQPFEPVCPQVEICSGCGNLSRGMRMAGWKGKEFDVPSLNTYCFYWLFETTFGSIEQSIPCYATEILHSNNHNLFRTVGFIAMLAAAPLLALSVPKKKCVFVTIDVHCCSRSHIQGLEHKTWWHSCLRTTLCNMDLLEYIGDRA